MRIPMTIDNKKNISLRAKLILNSLIKNLCTLDIQNYFRNEDYERTAKEVAEENGEEYTPQIPEEYYSFMQEITPLLVDKKKHIYNFGVISSKNYVFIHNHKLFLLIAFNCEFIRYIKWGKLPFDSFSLVSQISGTNINKLKTYQYLSIPQEGIEIYCEPDQLPKMFELITFLNGIEI